MKIEKGIPMPKPNTRGGKWDALLDEMKVGDSVLTTQDQARSLQGLGKRRGFVMTMRKQPDGQTRIWRTE